MYGQWIMFFSLSFSCFFFFPSLLRFRGSEWRTQRDEWLAKPITLPIHCPFFPFFFPFFYSWKRRKNELPSKGKIPVHLALIFFFSYIYIVIYFFIHTNLFYSFLNGFYFFSLYNFFIFEVLKFIYIHFFS